MNTFLTFDIQICDMKPTVVYVRFVYLIVIGLCTLVAICLFNSEMFLRNHNMHMVVDFLCGVK